MLTCLHLVQIHMHILERAPQKHQRPRLFLVAHKFFPHSPLKELFLLADSFVWHINYVTFFSIFMHPARKRTVTHLLLLLLLLFNTKFYINPFAFSIHTDNIHTVYFSCYFLLALTALCLLYSLKFFDEYGNEFVVSLIAFAYKNENAGEKTHRRMYTEHWSPANVLNTLSHQKNLFFSVFFNSLLFRLSIRKRNMSRNCVCARVSIQRDWFRRLVQIIWVSRS